MQKLKGTLSILLPAHNEGNNIYSNVLEVAKSAAILADNYEIIIINDGSTDATATEAARASNQDTTRISVINLTKNMGKGYALKTGTEQSIGDYVAFCDADLDLHPSQLTCFIDILHNTSADVVIGSKLHKDSVVEYPFIRRIYSYGYYFLLLTLFRLKVKDTQTGLKLFRGDIIRDAMRETECDGFSFDIEMLCIIQQAGYVIESAPVNLSYQRGIWGSRIHVKDIWNMLKETIDVFRRQKKKTKRKKC